MHYEVSGLLARQCENESGMRNKWRVLRCESGWFETGRREARILKCVRVLKPIQNIDYALNSTVPAFGCYNVLDLFKESLLIDVEE